MKKLLLGAAFLLSGGFMIAQNSIGIGSSSNAYGMLVPAQNQIFVDPALNVVGFVYRQNVSIWGGGAAENGKLRYSISTDGGVNWNTELGPLNTTYTRPARYPQSIFYNPTGNTNPLSAYIVWNSPTIPSNFDGIVNGTCQVATSNPVTTTENYQFASTSTYIQGGLCQGTPGVFWMVESATTTSDTTFGDSINVYKGTFSAGNVAWVKHTVLSAPHSTSFDGTRHMTRPNMAFSNDGQTGYVVFLGDIGTADSTYNPIIYKSTDAGTTWSSPTELIVDNIAGAGDSIKQFIFDTGTGLESAAEVAPAFDYDITVDANNNLHIFTTLCCVERRDDLGVVVGAKSYAVWSGYPKNAIDIYSTDGGTTWTTHYVAQVNQFRTTVPVSSGTLSVDNYNQISRTADGTIMFYSWSDTDTLIHQGASTNEAPNTFIAGFEISSGKSTCWKQIGGVANEDFVVTPTMAPYVLVGNNGGPEYTLPIVTQENVSSDATLPMNYYYVGKGAKFCDEDFQLGVNLSWVPEVSSSLPHCFNYISCFMLGVEDEQMVSFSIYPNPTSDVLNIQIEQGENIKNIQVVNNVGQVVRTLNPASLTNGSIFTLDVTGLAAGMYTVNMSTTGKTYSKKFTVVK
jgi:hypothetical protein